MPMQFTVLGSGSGGNSTLVRLDGPLRPRCVLIDAGLSPRETGKRLAQFGHHLQDVDDILITHLDRDHFREGWPRACRTHGIRVHLSRRHHRRSRLARLMEDRLRPFDSGPFELANGAVVDPVALAHDQLGTVGFVLEHEGQRLGLATDLGRVTGELLDHFINLDHLALESNYDRQMQLASERPGYLKHRIMGGAGHLSNTQAFEAVLLIAEKSLLRHVVLLHLSQECNHPDIIEALYTHHAPPVLEHLTLSHQHDPTPMLDGMDMPVLRLPQPAEQMIADRRDEAARPTQPHATPLLWSEAAS